MNFLIAGVIAPIAYFLIRYIVKSFVMSLIASAKKNSNVKNMVQCEKCKMFLDEDELFEKNGKLLCRKTECNK
tara:strand:+ start:1461 stop:1679 length:219 start_codon:yes stop_codon:yes gene_type:complete